MDTRPTATITLVNTMDVRVKGHIGDWYFDVQPRQTLEPALVHVDPVRGTSMSLWLAADPSCGAGDNLGLRAGRTYTAKVYQGGTCNIGGKTSPAPALSGQF